MKVCYIDEHVRGHPQDPQLKHEKNPLPTSSLSQPMNIDVFESGFFINPSYWLPLLPPSFAFQNPSWPPAPLKKKRRPLLPANSYTNGARQCGKVTPYKQLWPLSIYSPHKKKDKAFDTCFKAAQPVTQATHQLSASLLSSSSHRMLDFERDTAKNEGDKQLRTLRDSPQAGQCFTTRTKGTIDSISRRSSPWNVSQHQCLISATGFLQCAYCSPWNVEKQLPLQKLRHTGGEVSRFSQKRRESRYVERCSGCTQRWKASRHGDIETSELNLQSDEGDGLRLKHTSKSSSSSSQSCCCHFHNGDTQVDATFASTFVLADPCKTGAGRPCLHETGDMKQTVSAFAFLNSLNNTCMTLRHMTGRIVDRKRARDRICENCLLPKHRKEFRKKRKYGSMQHRGKHVRKVSTEKRNAEPARFVIASKLEAHGKRLTECSASSNPYHVEDTEKSPSLLPPRPIKPANSSLSALLPSIGCGLYVSASSLGRGSGLGLYAARPFSARSRIGEYAGLCVDRKVAMLLRSMGTSTHVMRVGMQHQYLVGYRMPFIFGGAGAFLNDGRWYADGSKGPGIGARFHVAYDRKRAQDRVYVVAARDLKAGEEIFTSYDNLYWALLA